MEKNSLDEKNLSEENKSEKSQSDFMIERIKDRPVNKKKLFRRSAVTAGMAVIFGLIACLTFLVLEPVISNWLYPEEEAAPIVFPEDQEEMAPEDMLSESVSNRELLETLAGSLALDEEEINNILSGFVMNKENYKQMYSAMSAYVTELNHSMVTVTGVSSNLDWFNNVEESKNQAPGVIIANTGKELLILADYGTLKKAESMTLSFSCYAGLNGETYQVPVTLKNYDLTANIAVLSVDIKDVAEELLADGGIRVATLGSSNIRNQVGLPIVALGSPLGISNSVGYGMITAVAGQTNQADTNYKFFVTDIYGSNNGSGFLFNLQGQVIGVISSQRPNPDLKNVVTALGISELKKSIEKMSNGEEIAYLGINGTDVTTDAHENMGVPYGAYVKNVDMNSPSMEAGIKIGDVITALGDKSINNYNDYINALMQSEAGSSMKLTIMRPANQQYREMEVKVTLKTR